MSDPKRAGRFKTIGTDGQEYIIAEYTSEDGVKEYRTVDGVVVRRITQGLYEIPGTGVTLSPVDLNAP